MFPTIIVRAAEAAITVVQSPAPGPKPERRSGRRWRTPQPSGDREEGRHGRRALRRRPAPRRGTGGGDLEEEPQATRITPTARSASRPFEKAPATSASASERSPVDERQAVEKDARRERAEERSTSPRPRATSTPLEIAREDVLGEGHRLERDVDRDEVDPRRMKRCRRPRRGSARSIPPGYGDPPTNFSEKRIVTADAGGSGP